MAWSEVTARHAILRTSFVWEGDVPGPLQIVHKRVPLMLAELDWRDRGLDDGELDHLVAEDRARGFDLTKAPLQRMTVVQLASGAHQLIWTHHHLLLDGWSAARQIEELLAHYRGESLRVPPGVTGNILVGSAGKTGKPVSGSGSRDCAPSTPQLYWRTRSAQSAVN